MIKILQSETTKLTDPKTRKNGEQLYDTPVLTLHPMVGKNKRKEGVLNKAALKRLANQDPNPYLFIFSIITKDGKKFPVLVNSRKAQEAGIKSTHGLGKLYRKSGRYGASEIWRIVLPYFEHEICSDPESDTAYLFDLIPITRELNGITFPAEVLMFKEEKQVKPIQHCIEATTKSNQQIKNQKQKR